MRPELLKPDFSGALTETPGRDRHREIPRHDDADDTKRLVESYVDTTTHGNLVSSQTFWTRRVVVEHVADVARFPHRVAPRVAGIAYFEFGKFLHVRIDNRSKSTQQSGALPRRDGPPGWQGCGRSVYCGINGREVGHLHICDGLFSRRVHHGICVAHGGSLTCVRSCDAAPSR